MKPDLSSIKRLQLGTSRLENLEPKLLETFLDKSWLHFGDAPVSEHNIKKWTWQNFVRKYKRRSLPGHIVHNLGKLFKKKGKQYSQEELEQLYEGTNFVEFYFSKGDQLPLEEESIDFVFSEHFFEHLFLDEILALFRECNRILKPNGVFRVCVPDSDLITICEPEVVGFPETHMPFTDPRKHKTRWSIYSLCEALCIAGFSPYPLVYSDKTGKQKRQLPISGDERYSKCPEQDLVYRMDFILRTENSLIVDGVKSAAPADYSTFERNLIDG